MDSIRALSCLSALGQETRLATFRLLVQSGPEGMLAGEISTKTNTVQNTMSSHLSVLLHAGLIRSQREGRAIRYFADMEGMRALLAFLLEDCCGGKPELCRQVLDEISCDCS